MYEAKFSDGGDCYEIHLVMAKPGTPSKIFILDLFIAP